MKITKAVIPCGGMGTRFLPVTKSLPKELLPIIATPALSYITEEAKNSGITDILIILGKGKEAIKNHFTTSKTLEDFLALNGKSDLLQQVRAITDGVNYHFTYQYDPKGSADAVRLAKDFAAGEPFCLAWGDDIVYSKMPVMAQLIDAYNRTKSSIVGVQKLLTDDIVKYGVARIKNTAIGSDGRTIPLSGFVEKPPLSEVPSRYAAMGRYLLTSDIFDEIDITPPGKNGEYQLTDAINSLCAKKNVYAYDFVGKRYDVGDKLGALKAQVEYGLREFGQEFSDYLKTLKLD